MNAAGLNEAGIDGGGLFREFMTELLKTAFDPNRGFFRLTKDQQLYPNPTVEQIEPDFTPHYYFIGRALGKALYENHLVELPLASFFLSKLLGQHSVNVDIDHLSSLDPELYKNLLYLKVSTENPLNSYVVSLLSRILYPRWTHKDQVQCPKVQESCWAMTDWDQFCTLFSSFPKQHWTEKHSYFIQQNCWCILVV